MRVVAMQVLVPRRVLVLRPHGIEFLETFGKAAGKDGLGSPCDLQCARDFRRRMTFLAHFNFDFLLVFVDHAYCEAEANDDKVHVRAIRCKRCYPSTLASGLIADATCTPSG